MRRAVSLSGVVFALLCLAMVLFALPAGAQDNGIPPNAPAVGEDTNGVNSFDVIVVTVNGCTVTSSPSITLEDIDERRATFIDRGDIDISTPNGRPRIEGRPDVFIGDLATPPNENLSRNGDYIVVRSEGITCGDDDEDTSAPQRQYEDEGEVDIEEDVIVGTTSKKKIPNTGGPPLLLFGALLLGAAVIAGRVVLRP